MKYVKIELENTEYNKNTLKKIGVIQKRRNKIVGKRGFGYKPRFTGSFNPKKRKFEKFHIYVTPQTLDKLKDNDLKYDLKS